MRPPKSPSSGSPCADGGDTVAVLLGLLREDFLQREQLRLHWQQEIMAFQLGP